MNSLGKGKKEIKSESSKPNTTRRGASKKRRTISGLVSELDTNISVKFSKMIMLGAKGQMEIVKTSQKKFHLSGMIDTCRSFIIWISHLKEMALIGQTPQLLQNLMDTEPIQVIVGVKTILSIGGTPPIKWVNLCLIITYT